MHKRTISRFANITSIANIASKVSKIGLICLAIAALTMPMRTAAQDSGPAPITYGQTVTGKLTTEKVEALYTFAATQGDAITVTMGKTDGTLDPLVILVNDTQQTVLAVDNDSGGDRNARLRFVIPVAGNYIIKATAVQGSGDINGSYTMTLTLDNAEAAPSVATSNAPQIAALQPGAAVQSNLSDATPFRIFALRVRANEAVAATLDIGADADKLQAGMYLYTPEFREVGRAELGQPLKATAPADGVYFLVVARVGNTGAGNFTLHQGAPATGGTDTLVIAPGQTVRGLISTENAVKTYSLQGAAGQTISARMRRLSGDLITYVYVVAIDTGTTLAQGIDNNGSAELSVELPATGSYAVVATRGGQQSGTTTGEYALTVGTQGDATPLPPAFQNYATIDYGETSSGTIDNTLFAVPYVFSAQTGDVIQATMSVDGKSDLDPLLLVQNEKGDTLAEDNNGGGELNARLQFTIPETGYYALFATRTGLVDGKTTGQFKLTFDTVNAPVTAVNLGKVLASGQPQNGVAEAAVGSVYRLEVPANSAVDFDVVANNSFKGTTLLTDSGFTQIAATGGSIPKTTLEKAGIYYLLIMRAGGPNATAAGDYTVTMHSSVVAPAVATAASGSASNASNVLTFGQSVTGAISNEIYQQRYTIEAQEGAVVTITMDAAPDSTLDPMVGLLDAENNVLGVNDDSSAGLKNSSLTVTIPKDGTYTIAATRAQEAKGTTAGAYVLTVNGPPQETKTAPDILPLRYGGIASGQIEAQQFLYTYVFTGSAGDVITIKMNSVPGTTLDAVLYLYDYSGDKPTLLASNNNAAPGILDAAIVKFKLPQSGNYLIAATRLDAAKGTTTGEFVLTLTKDE